MRHAIVLAYLGDDVEHRLRSVAFRPVGTRRTGVGVGLALGAIAAVATAVTGAGPLEPSQRECFAVAGKAGDVAVVNLTPVLATGSGNGLLVSSDVADPLVASNVNFASGTVDPNVAFAPIGGNGQVCFANSRHSTVNLVADHLGTIDREVLALANAAGTPERVLDTRASGSPLEPGARSCFAVAGATGDIAIVNLTPVQAAGPGNGLLVSSDIAAPPVASNVNFALGSVDPNVAFAPIGADGKVCYANSQHSQVDVIADHLGTIDREVFAPANAEATPARLADTRTSGSQVAPGARVCVPVAGAPRSVAVVNLTPVRAAGSGNGLLVSSDIAAPPAASNVNFGQGTTDPNVAFAPIGTDGRVCYVNSPHSHVDVIADHLGTIDRDVFTPANPAGTPERVVDTRDWRPDVYLNYHGSEALLGDTDSQWPFVRANLDGFWGYWSSTTDTDAGIDMAAELTRKVTGRKLVLEQDISIGYQCRGLNDDNFHGGTGIEGRAPDIQFERVAVAIYSGEIPECWAPVGGVAGIFDQYQSAGYDQVWSLWQASNVLRIEEGDDFPRIQPGSSAELAFGDADGLVIECHMDDCVHPAIRDEFFRVIAEAHARGQSFVWFTGYHPDLGYPKSGWLAKVQQTYNDIAAQGLWRPGDAVMVINYYGSYPALPERQPDGSPADTVTGVLAWLLEQNGS